jgi:hypothetical protein
MSFEGGLWVEGSSRMKYEKLGSRIFEDVHAVEDGEVAHELKEEADVGHVIQQVRVAQLLWGLVALSLRVEASAVAVARN